MLTINKRIAHTVVQTNQAVLPSTGSLSKYASDSNLMSEEKILHQVT